MITDSPSPSSSPSVISLDSDEPITKPNSPVMHCTDEQFTQNMAKILEQAKESRSLSGCQYTIPPTLPSQCIEAFLVGADLSASQSSSTSATEEHVEQPKFDTRYKDVNADLTLVSAEGVVFKVRSLYLRSASKFFDDKYLRHTTNSPIIFKLDDPAIERSSSVRLLLDFIHGNIPQPTYEILGIFRQAILLAKKYECKLVLMAMKQFARSSFDIQSFDCRFMFILGANLGDITICSEAIRKLQYYGCLSASKRHVFPEEWYEDDDEGNHEHALNEDRRGMEGEYAMDPSTWHVQDIQHVPARYLTALLRAHRLRKDESKNWDDVAERFKQLSNPPRKNEGKDGNSSKEKKTK